MRMECYICGKEIDEAAEEGIDYWKCYDGKSVIYMKCFEKPEAGKSVSKKSAIGL